MVANACSPDLGGQPGLHTEPVSKKKEKKVNNTKNIAVK